MKMIMDSGKNKKQYVYLLILVLSLTFLGNESIAQKSNMKANILTSKTQKQLNKVRLKTTITPRRGDVVFLQKAMEVIVTPVDELNNEIDSLPEGLPFKLYSNAPEDIKEANFNANRTINGKYYTYLTPMRVHDIKNNNELRIGAFLLKSDGLPDSSSGNFTCILVVDHIPKKPDTTSFKVYDLQYGVYITNSKLKLDKKTDKYIFSWGAAADSNNKTLIKSFKGPAGEIYMIEDTCLVKYKFGIKEYNFQPFPLFTDTAKSVILTGDQLFNIMTYMKGSIPTTVKSFFVHWYITFEDEIYNYSMPQYSNYLSTMLKTLEIYDDRVIGIGINDQNIFSSFSLFQNYPNPFNPSTSIAFYLPEKCYVNLKVYDGIGREVNTLINQTMPMGEHSVNFDAKALPAGAYFYRLQAGNYSEIKRMLYLK
jgi:hypothetical protein